MRDYGYVDEFDDDYNDYIFERKYEENPAYFDMLDSYYFKRFEDYYDITDKDVVDYFNEDALSTAYRIVEEIVREDVDIEDTRLNDLMFEISICCEVIYFDGHCDQTKYLTFLVGKIKDLIDPKYHDITGRLVGKKGSYNSIRIE